MKIGYQAVYDLEFETRGDKKIRLAIAGYNASLRVSSGFQGPDDSGPNGNHALIILLNRINEVSRLLIN